MLKKCLLEYWINSNLIKDKALLKAFEKINRENFVLPEYKSQAYNDIPLPIGYNATISQPITIMIMLQALEIKPNSKILEIGTGSGYTAALMSKIAYKGKIFSIDIIPELIEFARNNLKKENIKNIKLVCKDGSQGLKSESPFNRIIINAACKEIPKTLLLQLKNKGILIAPIGKYSQKMIKFTKINNKFKEEYLGDFIFVELKNNSKY